MKITKALVPITALCAVLGVAVVEGQTPTQKPAAGTQEPAKGGKPVEAAMPMPTITAEHGQLKKLVGTWDANVSCSMPGMPPSTSKGTATYKAVGETWVACDFSGQMMGQDFVGHGVDGYDPQKKKFVSTWVDSMSTAIMVMEGTQDAATKTITLVGDCPDPETGKPVKHRLVNQMTDADTMSMRMYAPGPDGKEAEVMKIDYKRRK